MNEQSNLKISEVKVGDRVICVYNDSVNSNRGGVSHLYTLGKEYVVLEIKRGMLYTTTDSKDKYGAFPQRFILAKQKELKKEVW